MIPTEAISSEQFFEEVMPTLRSALTSRFQGGPAEIERASEIDGGREAEHEQHGVVAEALREVPA